MSSWPAGLACGFWLGPRPRTNSRTAAAMATNEAAAVVVSTLAAPKPPRAAAARVRVAHRLVTPLAFAGTRSPARWPSSGPPHSSRPCR